MNTFLRASLKVCGKAQSKISNIHVCQVEEMKAFLF